MNLQPSPTPFWAFKNQDFTLIFYIEDEGLDCFLLCMLGFILQWAWPLWVKAGFPPYSFVTKLETKD